jgi:hypothetical protein
MVEKNVCLNEEFNVFAEKIMTSQFQIQKYGASVPSSRPEFNTAGLV